MKKILLSLLSVFAVAAPSWAAEKEYQLCTDLEQIKDSNNKFLIVSPTMKNNQLVIASSTLESTFVGDTYEAVPDKFTIDAESKSLALISIVKNGDSYAIFENNTEKYWGVPTSNKLTSSAFETLPITDTQYQISVSLDSSNHVLLSSVAGGSSRYVQFNLSNNPPIIRSYTSAQTKPLFYKEVEAGPIVPTFSGYDAEYTIQNGEDYAIDLPAIQPADLDYTFTSENTAIVEISNGKIIGLTPGQTTVKFTTAATDNYQVGNGSFTVTVTKLQPELDFQDEVVYAKVGVGAVWHPVTIVKPSDPEQQGKITYTSSDPSIVSINEEEGQVTKADVHAPGTVTITATMEETETYAEGSASYTIIVYDPEASAASATSTFDFTKQNPYGFTTFANNSGSMETKTKEIYDETVTISFTGQYRSFTTSDGGYELRLQKSSTMTISVPEEYKITKIGLAAKGDTSTLLKGSFSPASGTDIPDGESGNNTGDEIPNQTWVPANGAVVSSVTYSAGNNASEIWYIVVEYELASSDLITPDLSFSQPINGIYVNEEGSINAVNNKFNRPITYEIVGLTEGDDYTITPDGENLKVLVKVAGSFALYARSDAGDGYRDGLAIMRLNVYNHLAVSVEGATLSTNDEGVEEIDTTNATEVTFTVPEFAKLYYQIVTSNTPSTQAEGDETTDDVNCKPGFEYDDDGVVEIPAKTNGALNFYIANYGYISPIRTIMLNDPTGSAISEVEAAGSAVYFDLQGRKVAVPARGIYVRTQGGKSTKVRI